MNGKNWKQRALLAGAFVSMAGSAMAADTNLSNVVSELTSGWGLVVVLATSVLIFTLGIRLLRKGLR